MGKENSITTGTTRARRVAGLSNSSTLSSILPTSSQNYGIVQAVNPTTREIRYTPIINNLASNKTGAAIPKSTNMVHLPKPGYVVRLEIGPNTDITVPGSSGANVVYYDPNPVGIWGSIDDNKVEVAPSKSPATPVSDLSLKNINQAQIGIPNGG